MSSLGSLIQRYDVPVPRYTSYPTIPTWMGINTSDWKASVHRCLKQKMDKSVGAISLYVHVPYCHSLCAFCACTRQISRDLSLAPRFVDAILKELELKRQALELDLPSLQLCDIHLGGGTPTWLPAAELERLLVGLCAPFLYSSSPQQRAEISIEIDPRTFTQDHALALARAGLKRASLGIQDFYEPTLKAIKRFQTREQVAATVDALRANGVSSINFDLVYGLPHQTVDTVRATGVALAQHRPNRVALYSYAHLPAQKPAQRGVEKHGLPDAPTKRALYETLRNGLLAQGYIEIGMDHFALPQDEMAHAHFAGKLHRNFMGYTVQRTPLLIGLGPSALSDSWFAFSQNEKDPTKWKQQLDENNVEPVGGHLLSDEDLRRRQIILDLMCRQRVSLDDKDWQEILHQDPIRDELATRDSLSGVLQLTERGRPFLRNVCSLFDTHIHSKLAERSHISFSRAV